MQVLLNGETLGECCKGYIRNIKDNSINVSTIKKLKKADALLSNIKKNSIEYMLLAFLIAITLKEIEISMLLAMGTKVASTSGLGWGMQFYNPAVTIAKVISMIGFITESGKAVLMGTLDEIGRVSLKYGAFLLIINFLPRIVDWIFTL